MPEITVHGKKLDTLEKVVAYHLEDVIDCSTCKYLPEGGVCTKNTYECGRNDWEPSQDLIDEIMIDINRVMISDEAPSSQYILTDKHQSTINAHKEYHEKLIAVAGLEGMREER